MKVAGAETCIALLLIKLISIRITVTEQGRRGKLLLHNDVKS